MAKKEILLLFLLSFPIYTLAQSDPYKEQRNTMVTRQILERGVTDKNVLKAMRTVPRHEFVLPEYQKYSYADSPLPIEEGQTISQPYIVAFMTEALELQASDRVLEIGTGSGYQAAILAQICDSVFTIDIFQLLTKNSEEVFDKLGYDNIYCRTGDGYEGWPEKAPFDAIIVTCSPSHIPNPLKEQLAEGGRMIIPVGKGRIQRLILLQKKRGKIHQKNVLPVRFVPMLDHEGEKY